MTTGPKRVGRLFPLGGCIAPSMPTVQIELRAEKASLPSPEPLWGHGVLRCEPHTMRPRSQNGATGYALRLENEAGLMLRRVLFS